MPLWHCNECHHEWEGVETGPVLAICAWCGGFGYMLSEKTPLQECIEAFKREDYNTLVSMLDTAMAVLTDLGKSEAEAQEMLKDFITTHYFKVWRKWPEVKRG